VNSLGAFSGAFMAAYVLPPLLVAFFVGRYTKKFGKKYGAIISFFLGSCLLLLFPFFGMTPWILLGVFFASVGISLSLPSINGAYADYIAETEEYEKEIEGLQDFYTNLGFVFGPMSAGYLSDTIGNLEAFVFLGLFCGAAVVVLTLFMPKSINVKESMQSLK
jgi:MFS family permease